MSELSVKNLRKMYGKKMAVDKVSFSMQVGEVVGLLGPNGAGKTTIFYSIVGFVKPTTGIIQVNGNDITGEPMYKRARRGIAYLPQETSVFRQLSVENNIRAILEIRKLTNTEKYVKLEELLIELGIDHVRKQKANTLSGGERRRTEIARALAMDPQFLLLDEPFAGIDPIAVQDIKIIIKDLAERGIGVLITDHNVRDTLEITTRSYIINLGNIVAKGSREELLENSLARKVYLGDDFKM